MIGILSGSYKGSSTQRTKHLSLTLLMAHREGGQEQVQTWQKNKGEQVIHHPIMAKHLQ